MIVTTDEFTGEYQSYVAALVSPRLEFRVLLSNEAIFTEISDAGIRVHLADGSPYHPVHWVWLNREALRLRLGWVYSAELHARAGLPASGNPWDAQLLFALLSNIALDARTIREYPGIPYRAYAAGVRREDASWREIPTRTKYLAWVRDLYRDLWERVTHLRLSNSFPGLQTPAGPGTASDPVPLPAPGELSLPPRAALPKKLRSLRGLLARLAAQLEDVASLEVVLDALRALHGALETRDLLPVAIPPVARVKLGAVSGLDGFRGPAGLGREPNADGKSSPGGNQSTGDGAAKIGQGATIKRTPGNRTGAITGYLAGKGPRDPMATPLVVRTLDSLPALARYGDRSIEDGRAYHRRAREKYASLVETLATMYALHKHVRETHRNQPTGRVHVADAIAMRAEQLTFHGHAHRFPFERYAPVAGDAVLFVLDLSGSMRGPPIKISRLFAIVIAEVLRATPVHLAIVGYGARPRHMEVSEVVFKRFSKPLQPAKLGLVDVNWEFCENRDADLLRELPKFFERDLTGRHVEHRNIVIINDELPNHMDLTGERGRQVTIESLRLLRDRGFRVYGLSFNTKEVEYLREWYGDHHFERVPPYPIDDDENWSIRGNFDYSFRFEENLLDFYPQVRQMAEFTFRVLNDTST